MIDPTAPHSFPDVLPPGMSVATTQANMTMPTNFALVLRKFKDSVYFAKSMTLPELSGSEITHHTIVAASLKNPGIRANPGQLEIEMIADARLLNYRRLLGWLKQSFPYRGFADVHAISQIGSEDATIIAYTNRKNPFLKIELWNAFPTAISELQFELNDADPEPTTFKLTLSVGWWRMSTIGPDPYEMEMAY